MTKNDLVHRLSYRTGLSEMKCEKVIDMFAEEIIDSLIHGEKVILKNFMTFEITQRPERQGRHPQTGEATIYPPVKSIKCKISKYFRDSINGKRDE